ncbi:hypothetical protein FIBSPDRAFT_964757 [Athelia psychrophila]|uniref:Uncharacterized protein n=1 Tax=Athelia psychrophila TaxID=1759441 RepID=A0A165XCQ4_9AGAM|nr:hypothetical protein FIBSPDRAFT_964757 [Fibularhizoctonia sp. CBS 109695]
MPALVMRMKCHLSRNRLPLPQTTSRVRACHFLAFAPATFSRSRLPLLAHANARTGHADEMPLPAQPPASATGHFPRNHLPLLFLAHANTCTGYVDEHVSSGATACALPPANFRTIATATSCHAVIAPPAPFERGCPRLRCAASQGSYDDGYHSSFGSHLLQAPIFLAENPKPKTLLVGSQSRPDLHRQDRSIRRNVRDDGATGAGTKEGEKKGERGLEHDGGQSHEARTACRD